MSLSVRQRIDRMTCFILLAIACIILAAIDDFWFDLPTKASALYLFFFFDFDLRKWFSSWFPFGNWFWHLCMKILILNCKNLKECVSLSFLYCKTGLTLWIWMRNLCSISSMDDCLYVNSKFYILALMFLLCDTYCWLFATNWIVFVCYFDVIDKLMGKHPWVNF